MASATHGRTWRSRSALTTLLVLAGLGPVARADAATGYLIDSVAGCQAFLNAKGATLGTAEPGRCTVASTGSETALAADETLTVATGWELFISAQVFVDHGHI